MTSKLSKLDHALIGLGRVHAYTTYLCKLHLMSNDNIESMCREYYVRRPEVSLTMGFDDALKEALARREDAFNRSKVRANP